MSKQSKSTPSVIVEPKILSFYSVDQQDGGYRILEVSIDVNSNKIVEAKTPTEPEVLAIAFTQLQRKIRAGLGL